jgi:cell division protein ZipA
MSNNNLIYLKILAKSEHKFIGYELQQALAAAGFKFIAEDVLHHYGDNENLSEPLFTLTSTPEPKVFDMQHIGKWSCSGLILYMQLSKNRNHKKILELMVETAKRLADDLGGELIDDQKQPIDGSSVTRWEIKINRFEAQARNGDLLKS